MWNLDNEFQATRFTTVLPKIDFRKSENYGRIYAIKLIIISRHNNIRTWYFRDFIRSLQMMDVLPRKDFKYWANLLSHTIIKLQHDSESVTFLPVWFSVFKEWKTWEFSLGVKLFSSFFFLAPNVEQQNVDHSSMCDVIKRFLKTLKLKQLPISLIWIISITLFRYYALVKGRVSTYIDFYWKLYEKEDYHQLWTRWTLQHLRMEMSVLSSKKVVVWKSN